MKKITILGLLLSTFVGFSQVKTTGNVNILPTLIAKFDMDSATSLVTLQLQGPSDRWFACTFGNQTGGMQAGRDVVYWNGTTLVDATHVMQGTAPTTDAINAVPWTITSNFVLGTSRFIFATRPFVGDAGDYTFNYANASINIAGSRANTAILTPLQYHGQTNRTNMGAIQFSQVLTTEDFSLNATAIYPNPSNGSFSVQTKTNLNSIDVYSQTGQLVKTIIVDDKSNKVDIQVKGLSTGIYLIELKNDSEKSWKKVIVE